MADKSMLQFTAAPQAATTTPAISPSTQLLIRKALQEMMSPATLPSTNNGRTYPPPPRPPVPQWLLDELRKLQRLYRRDEYTAVMQLGAYDAHSGAMLTRDQCLRNCAAGVLTLYSWVSVIACRDCPGGVFTTGSAENGAEESIAGFRLHAKSVGHRRNVEMRLERGEGT